MRWRARFSYIALKSGIGPLETLHNASITPLVSNEFVGRNLQDHLIFPVIFSHQRGAFPSRPTRELIDQAVVTRTGPLTSNIAEAGGFFSLDAQGEIQWDPSPSTFIPQPQFQWHITPTHYLEYPIRDTPTAALSIGVTPLHPKSRGSVSIKRLENNAFEAVVDPDYLSDSGDRDEFVAAIQQTRHWIINSGLVISDELANSNEDSLFDAELLPGRKRSSAEQISGAISRYATTLYHYAGTCAAQQSSDSACDQNFQVRGCENLYVCDGSSLPTLPSGNTQVSVMMLARLFLNRLQ